MTEPDKAALHAALDVVAYVMRPDEERERKGVTPNAEVSGRPLADGRA